MRQFRRVCFKSESDQSHYMIPLMLDLSASRILILGAGAVGQRKAAYFAGQGKELVIEDTIPENLEETVSSFDFVVAATASEAENARICAACRAQNIWCNSATDKGTFLPPAAHFAENYTLAVSTNGKAPAAASFLRDYLTSALPAFPAMVSLQEILRAELKDTVSEQKRRSEILSAVLADEPVWQALESGDFAGALDLSRRHL